MKIPPFLRAGDKIALVCPAGYIKADLEKAFDLLRSWDLDLVVGDSFYAQHHQFAGDDTLRANDFQAALDNPEIKAVIMGRGGYGFVRIVDRLHFTNFKKNPKWLVGFSDITVLHSHIQRQTGIPTIHGPMVNSLLGATTDSRQSLQDALFGRETDLQYQAPDLPHRPGKTEGILTGGNLAILHSILNSSSDVDYTGKILFIEDIGEAYYNIDRMLWTLKRANKLNKLAGLIVGSFTNLRDNTPPFGQSVEEIILDKITAVDFPVAFGCPVGHIPDNRALVMGRKIQLSVQKSNISIHYID